MNEQVGSFLFFTRQSERVYVQDRQTRKLLRRYASTQDKLSDSEFQQLITSSALNAPELSELLDHCKKSNCTCGPPPELRPLLRALSSESPVSALIHSAALPILKE